MANEVVGREAQLASIDRFLDALTHGPTALILAGQAGIGKTTLWKEAVAAASRRSFRILSCRPAESEMRLSFAALGDLIGDAVAIGVPTLPTPQREALEAALLLAPTTGSRPDRRAVSLAVLGVIRSLAEHTPLLVAVDDVQWLDLPSAGALSFALRRLLNEPVGVLLASRETDLREEPLGLSASWPEASRHRLDVGPLGVEAIGALIDVRLQMLLRRTTVLRLHRTSGGNPFYAMEIARALGRRGLEEDPAQPLPVPENLQALVRARLQGLPKRTVAVLQIVAGASHPTADLVRSALPNEPRLDEAIETARRAGVVEIERGRIRFVHPLFASVVYQAIPSRGRTALHRRLASLVDDVEERARHRALSTSRPDVGVAAELDGAARVAAARAAPGSAAELWEMARRLTPADRRGDLRRRILEEASSRVEAGDIPRASELYEEAVATSPSGPERAETLRRLGMTRAAEETWREAAVLFERALPEAGDDALLLRAIEQDLGYAHLFVGNLAEAERHARVALAHAERLGAPEALAESLSALTFLEFVLGRGARFDRMERAEELERASEDWWLVLRPSFVTAQLLKYTDRLDEARSRFESLLRLAAERGQESPTPVLLYHLAELECWAGRWDRAAQHAERAAEAGRQTGMTFYQTMARYAVALVEAHLGRTDPARAAAREGLDLAERTGVATTTVLNRAVLGFLELSLGDLGGAHEQLRRAGEVADSMGVGEPGYFHFLPDDIEALALLGRLDEAAALLEPYEERAHALDRTWALATAARCRALLLASAGDPSGALAAAESALGHHERLPRPFDHARTLLVAGTIQRRAKRRGDARTSLEQARSIFEGLGAPLWAAKAASELGRIGGRAPTRWELTPAERRVADLVAAGHTNRQVADALFVSVNTVEASLKSIYRKLQVGSRTEMARALARAHDPEA